MKLNRVSLSKLEYQWLANNVVRTKQILEKAAEKDPGVKDRVTFKTLSAVESLFPTLVEDKDQYDVMLSRKQKQVMGNMAMTTMLILNDRIIPEYERRILEGNDLTQHLNDVKIKVSVLKGLHKKLQ